MPVILLFCINIYSANALNNILLPKPASTNLYSCVTAILNQQFLDDTMIAYVDINSTESLLPYIEQNVKLSVISRTPNVRLTEFNENYLIHAQNIETFTQSFGYLKKESEWNPRAKFLIVLNELDGDLYDLFDKLMEYHVFSVVVVDASEDLNLFTYNPFDNYGCGKFYNSIISYGKCQEPNVHEFYPDKFVTGLRNCTFNVECAHWPPFAISPEVTRLYGVEQFIFQILSEMEHFDLNYTFVDTAEDFSLVKPDMSVTGPLARLHSNDVDISIGGMMLVAARADAFDYVWSHLAYSDQFIILVRKSRDIDAFKYIYIEFSKEVWILVIIAFVSFSLLLLIYLRVDDKFDFVLKMFYALLGHALIVKLPQKLLSRILLIQWIWFACLISLHYQSYLTSFNTHPLKVYQISEIEDLKTYKLKSCLSTVMMSVLKTLLTSLMHIDSFEKFPQERCLKLLQSIETVSESDGVFTISFEAVYNYYKHNFCDEVDCKMYQFRQPLNKIMFAIYFYKGFPLLDKLHMHTLHLRETGLINEALNVIHYAREIDNKVYSRKVNTLFVIPWHILLTGFIMASFAFAIENIIFRLKNS